MNRPKPFYQALTPINGFKWCGWWDSYHHFVKQHHATCYEEIRATDEDIDNGNLKFMIENNLTK